MARRHLLHCGRSIARLRAAALAALACVLLAPAAAQTSDDEDAARVGRVASFEGQLFVAPQDRAEEWAAASLNYPVATGDNLWMSGAGRAEVDYGGGQVRLGADSNVHVSRLDDRQVALFIAQGQVVVRVRMLEPGESAVIDTPNAQVELVRPGSYRIDVSPDPAQTWVIVREGEANVALPSGLQQVLPGQTATVAGIDSAVAEVRNGVTSDALDAWSADRDRVYEGGRQAASYVSPETVGYADLDAYGQWQPYAEYGAVWFPNDVSSDWAPYRYGHWISLATYGWTWVDDAPWGYAPFHYGRWVHVGGRWGWCPGVRERRAVWAPALVAWFGGNGWSVAASTGAPVYGWVPLGWREPFVPWWGRCGGRCYERYNRPYAVNVAERPNRPPTFYANRSVPGAVTAVPGAAFRGAKPVQANRVPLPAQALAAAPMLRGAPQVKPLPVSTNVVRAGRNAPLPAGQIAARVKPMALAPAARATGGTPPVRGAVIPAPASGSTQRAVVNAPAQRAVGNAPDYDVRRGRIAEGEAAPMNATPPASRRVSPAPGAALPTPRELAPAPAPRSVSPPVTVPAAPRAPLGAVEPLPSQPRMMRREPVERPMPQAAPPAPRVAPAAPAYVPPAPRAAPPAAPAYVPPAPQRAAPAPPAPQRVAPAPPAPVHAAPPPAPARQPAPREAPANPETRAPKPAQN